MLSFSKLYLMNSFLFLFLSFSSGFCAEHAALIQLGPIVVVILVQLDAGFATDH